MQAPLISLTGTCHGARSQIAIHASGEVVPCCLDKEADVNFGNIHGEKLVDILQSPRFQKVKQGFLNNQLTEELCQRCSFRTRF